MYLEITAQRSSFALEAAYYAPNTSAFEGEFRDLEAQDAQQVSPFSL